MLFLGVTQGDTALSPPYLHVLGFNDRGQEVLRRMRDTAKKPVLMRASGLRTLSPRRANDLPVERVRNGSFRPCHAAKATLRHGADEKTWYAFPARVDTSQSICYNKRKLNRPSGLPAGAGPNQTETAKYR